MTPVLLDRIPVDLVATFSAARSVFRAFGCAIAAGNGTLLLVPWARMAPGADRQVIAGCPVPYEDVLATLQASPARAARPWGCYGRSVQQLERLDLDHWDVCRVRLPRSDSGAMVFVAGEHQVRFAATLDLALRSRRT